MDSDGSNVIRLTHAAGIDEQPAWSPDGHRIAFTSNRGGTAEIYVMDANGTNVVQLTKGNQSAFSVLPAWSPDGGRIAHSSNRDGDVEIYVMNPDGSDVVQLTTGGGMTMPAWSPDGRRIAFASDRDGYIWVMAADGSATVQVTRD
jgi:Tol biopolymer transport system component